MTEKRFRKGKSILTDFPTGAIIDEKTGERYYDGIKPSYISSKELVKILNELYNENEQLKKDLNSISHNWALIYDEAKNKVEELSKENKKLKSINNQLENRLEESGIGIALKMEELNG